MSRLRILQVYKDIYPPVVGGVEKHIHDVCRGLRGLHDFSLLVAHDRARTERTDLDGLPVVKAATLGRFASAPVCPTFPLWLARLAREADLLHFHLPMPTAVMSWLATRPAPPVIVTWHSDIVRQRWALGIYGPFLRAFLRRTRLIMPTTDRYAEFSPFLQPLRDRCRAVPLGIDVDAFAPSPDTRGAAGNWRRRFGTDTPLVGFVGVLRAYKGLAFLIDAMARLPDSVRLLVMGDGPERPALEARVREAGLSDRVHFLGAFDDADLPGFLQAIDVYCLPSHLRSEAYGLSQIEAMAAGKPVVSCDLETGVPWVNRHEETGLVVPPGRPEALAVAIGRLLENPDLRRRLGECARRRAVQHFSRDRMLGRLDEIYREVAAR